MQIGESTYSTTPDIEISSWACQFESHINIMPNPHSSSP